MTYLQLLNQNQKDREQQQVEYSVEKAQIQLQSDILATKQAIKEVQRKVLTAKSAQPFNSQNIITALAELEGYQSGLEKLTVLQAELFPAGV